MFKRILVPLDGSVRAEQALPLAARLARVTQGSVILTQVVQLPSEYAMYAAPATPPPALLQADRSEAVAYLQHVAHHDALAGLNVETEVVTGLTAQEILGQIAERHADAVVMSSHGRTGLARWVLGSVAEHVSRAAPVPVLIVRDNDIPFQVSAQRTRQPRVLVPLDGSPLAERALEPAVSLAMAFGTDLHLLLVVMPMEAMRENMPEALVMDGAKGYLNTIAQRLRAEHSDLGVGWSVGVDVDPATAIIRMADGSDDTEGAGVAGGCDVIAMATHGRTGFSRWAMGSMTERVLHAAKHSMLIVRSREHVAHDTHESALESDTASPAADPTKEKSPHDRIVDQLPAFPLF